MCLGHCQASAIELVCENVNAKELLTILAKKLSHRYCHWQGPQYVSGGYVSTFCLFWIILNFEFHILAKLMFAGIHKLI